MVRGHSQHYNGKASLVLSVWTSAATTAAKLFNAHGLFTCEQHSHALWFCGRFRFVLGHQQYRRVFPLAEQQQQQQQHSPACHPSTRRHTVWTEQVLHLTPTQLPFQVDRVCLSVCLSSFFFYLLLSVCYMFMCVCEEWGTTFFFGKIKSTRCIAS